MTLLTGPIAHIALSDSNDHGGTIRHHVGKRMEGGVPMHTIVEDAWRNKDRQRQTGTRSHNVNPPDFLPVEIYYDPKGVGNAPEDEVLEALRKAGS